MKDPAALIYIDKWLVSTKGMKASARGWYLNLILHQYDKGSLPNNTEDLADFADVKHSEFEEFKQVFEQVLKQKFVENSEGRLVNEFALEIIRKRENFKEKRSDSGKLSYILKYIRKNHINNKDFEVFLKENIDLNFDTKNEQMLEQVFKQNFELYINENEDKDINIDLTKKENKNIEKSKPIILPIQFSDVSTELKTHSKTKEFCIKTYFIKPNDYDRFVDWFIGTKSNQSDDEIVCFKEWNQFFKEWMKFNYDKLPQQQEQKPKAKFL
jgi:hypothetical protein